MVDTTVSVTRVLVPLDASDWARQVLDPAVRIARASGCPMELVTVYDPVRGNWAQDLDELADGLPHDDIDVSVVGAGWPGDVIAGMAGEQRGTLLCMSALHRDELARLVLGSVSAHVLRAAEEPVLLVGPGHRAEDAPERYRRLVVCLDGSTRSESALTAARAWGRDFGLELELVHVADPTRSEVERERLHTRLTGVADELSGSTVPTTATLLTGDNPAEAIAELLGERPDALALTASHGRTGFTRLLLGGVTAELLTRSPCPVLVSPTSD